VPSRYGGAGDDFNDAAHIGYSSSDTLLRFLLTNVHMDAAVQAAGTPAD
jgi:hypothetical protein